MLSQLGGVYGKRDRRQGRKSESAHRMPVGKRALRLRPSHHEVGTVLYPSGWSQDPPRAFDRPLRTCFAAVLGGAAALVAVRMSTEANAMPKRALALAFVSVIAFASSAAVAAVSAGARTAGQLDPSFGTRGVVRT